MIQSGGGDWIIDSLPAGSHSGTESGALTERFLFGGYLFRSP
jgi:hypothetical protein